MFCQRIGSVSRLYNFQQIFHRKSFCNRIIKNFCTNKKQTKLNDGSVKQNPFLFEKGNKPKLFMDKDNKFDLNNLLNNPYLIVTFTTAVTLWFLVKTGIKGVILLAIPFGLYYKSNLKLIYDLLDRDIPYIKRYLLALKDIYIMEQNKLTLYDCFVETVYKNPSKVMVYYENQKLTYKDIDDKVAKYANILNSLKLEKGDPVGLYVTRSPELIALILAISKQGLVAALINSSFSSKELLQKVQMGHCKVLIFSEELRSNVDEVASSFGTKMNVIQLSTKLGTKYKVFEELPIILGKLPSRCYSASDPLFYIYKTDIYGFTRASVLPHYKFLSTVVSFTHMLDLKSTDIIYDPLPLSSMNLFLGIGPSMIKGIPIVLKQKFDAETYFRDCKQFGCTIGLCAGDMCTYLLLKKKSLDDTNHNLRLMYGNALNEELWYQFHNRFNVKLCELYGAPESNLHLVNKEGIVGAVGFVPKLIPKMFHPFVIVRIDENTRKPLRGADGFCQRCNYNEPGLLLSFLRNEIDPLIYGQSESDATTPHVIMNVFTIGDIALASKDIFYMDKSNYIYYNGKIVNTIEWLGKNYTNIEIEDILRKYVGNYQCTVYAVELPNQKGRPGMIAIKDPNNQFDLFEFQRNIKENLPPEQRPVFLRLASKLNLDTIDFVAEKSRLANEGFNPKLTYDKLYFYNKATLTYEPITTETYKSIQLGNIKF